MTSRWRTFVTSYESAGLLPSVGEWSGHALVQLCTEAAQMRHLVDR